MPVNALMHMAVAVGVDAAVDRIRKKLLSIGAWGSLHALVFYLTRSFKTFTDCHTYKKRTPHNGTFFFTIAKVLTAEASVDHHADGP